MAQITAFKCDQCGKIYENRHAVLYVDANHNFEIKEYSRYPSIEKGVCSNDCAKAALDEWILDRQMKADEETAKSKEVVNLQNVAKNALNAGILKVEKVS